MSIQTVGMRAYSDALRHFTQVQSSLQQGAPVSSETLFAKTLDQSLLRDTVDKGENFGAQADFIAYPTTALQTRPNSPSTASMSCSRPKTRLLWTLPRAATRMCTSL